MLSAMNGGILGPALSAARLQGALNAQALLAQPTPPRFAGTSPQAKIESELAVSREAEMKARVAAARSVGIPAYGTIVNIKV